MKLIPLRDIFALSKEKLDEKLAPARAKQARSKAELKMAELEEKIGSKHQAILEMLIKKDFDFDKIMDEYEEIALLELRSENFKTMLGELFPEEVK